LAISSTAITILYIFSLVLASKLFSIPKKFVNLFVPSCSNALLSSGWNITTNAITPDGKKAVNTECTIFKFSNPLIQVINIKNTIPFISCIALDFFASFSIFTIMYITIVKSNISETNLIGCCCNRLKYSDMFSPHVVAISVIKFSFIFYLFSVILY